MAEHIHTIKSNLDTFCCSEYEVKKNPEAALSAMMFLNSSMFQPKEEETLKPSDPVIESRTVSSM